MPAQTTAFTRVFGNDAVLHRLERLGRDPRVFPNLVKAGFPGDQLAQASQWFAQDAGTPVDRYASQQMARGFFEDESLLRVFCRYYECTDWKLELSPWFFSQQDYERFTAAVVNPVEFHTAQLEQGLGEERWGHFFIKLPFDLGMDQARLSLWQEVCTKEYFWKPMETYAHLRSEMLFRYLRRTVDILNFSPYHYNYYWERAFREAFHAALRRFEQTLERWVRFWQEVRRERTRERFRYRSFHGGPESSLVTAFDVQSAFHVLGLDPTTATLTKVRRAFRRLSKQTHPDHGGDAEAFRRISESKAVAEAWLLKH